jgi:hypothetical protein
MDLNGRPGGHRHLYVLGVARPLEGELFWVDGDRGRSGGRGERDACKGSGQQSSPYPHNLPHGEPQP